MVRQTNNDEAVRQVKRLCDNASIYYVDCVTNMIKPSCGKLTKVGGFVKENGNCLLVGQLDKKRVITFRRDEESNCNRKGVDDL